MIIVIRMRGHVGVDRKIEATLQRLRLQKKFTATLVRETKEIGGMLKKAMHYVAYDVIDKDMLKSLIIKRGMKVGNKKVSEKEITDKIVQDLIEGKVSLQALGIKPFFRLHPPIGGFKNNTRLLFPKGVLGHNKKLNELLKKML
ncbi:50S ribosomal protein L30 [Candidatus Pacearchaeota archaeon]|nr:50S ribosomal protein L30 [Candidatus Pacearchaeota archaeon]